MFAATVTCVLRNTRACNTMNTPWQGVGLTGRPCEHSCSPEMLEYDAIVSTMASQMVQRYFSLYTKQLP